MAETSSLIDFIDELKVDYWYLQKLVTNRPITVNRVECTFDLIHGTVDLGTQFNARNLRTINESTFEFIITPYTKLLLPNLTGIKIEIVTKQFTNRRYNLTLTGTKYPRKIIFVPEEALDPGDKAVTVELTIMHTLNHSIELVRDFNINLVIYNDGQNNVVPSTDDDGDDSDISSTWIHPLNV